MYSSRMRTARTSSRHGGGGLDQIPLNFPLGCGPGPDPPKLPPWVRAWKPGEPPPRPGTPPGTRHPPTPTPGRRHTPPGTRHTPVNRITDTCKNITLPQTSFAGGKYSIPKSILPQMGCLQSYKASSCSKFQNPLVHKSENRCRHCSLFRVSFTVSSLKTSATRLCDMLRACSNSVQVAIFPLSSSTHFSLQHLLSHVTAGKNQISSEEVVW